ncbi:TetR/AcrR family transcriptional regulator [Cellulomonas sp. 73-145]|uniref:TetR/AcrR family transcriptional regulator n=1 Tax=Cellulomonas sp. 73-145 TaxID=1895739 RepID=UPI001ACA1982|nr:TetR/AcrR family transcriptional regulator [Cellulomonas sp. 73-145]MBN9327240.1 TetR/AcrR family transcriptional regulator [Cellulomonas sp.]
MNIGRTETVPGVRTTASPRAYVMRERAEQVEHTRRSALVACAELAYEVPLAALTLARVAERAGVSVQTLLRQFGSREGLLDAAHEWGVREVLAERPADPGDLDASFDALMTHYEARGDGVLLLLGQESFEPRARLVTERGRQLHRDWVGTVFAPWLDVARDPEALWDELVVVTDVYAWKLLRRDRGMDAAWTARRMRALVDAVLAATTPAVVHD